MAVQPPPKKTWPWVVGGLAPAGAQVTATAGQGESGARGQSGSRAPSGPASPSLPTNGVLKVGTDITPGEYAVTPTSGMGYWERLSCLTGEFECIIANDLVDGSGYLSVMPSDTAVRVRDVRLEKTSDTPSGNSGNSGTGGNSGSMPAGIDAQGFVGVTAARCNASDPAVAAARTSASMVAICQTGAGRLYYRGARSSDGAGIEIDDPTRTSDGFQVTNEGVTYRLNSSALVITRGSEELSNEPVIEYWSGP
ncbi:hypothetical protein [Rhodococcus sp. HNM0569]|uniref:hypothetical protein n=1 Tax=Rhodococcus sp. HNM0569 TaxID=2716340 RepID=UPI00146CB387|nr:hypothetical protein [Rhodococcus sp. HNM0569]NLU84559.1 hypothetical protein [Rhodococcus sp. HNM0569]